MMSSDFAADAAKQPCRLCYYDSDDTVPIFDDAGLAADFVGKIARYLYLRVRAGDHLPQAICWMCKQHLTTFDLFDTKINAIQRQRLKDGYEELAIERPAAEEQPAEVTIDEVATNIEANATGSEEALMDDPETFDPEPEIDYSRRTRSSLQRNTALTSAAIVNSEEAIEASERDDIENESDDKNEDAEFVLSDSLPISEPQKSNTSSDQPVVVIVKRYKPAANAPPPRKRGRPAKVHVENAAAKRVKMPVSHASVVRPEAAEPDEYDEGTQSEGESEDDFPAARKDHSAEIVAENYANDGSDDEAIGVDKSGDTDWAELMAQGMFPAEVLKDGLLLFKGKKLMKIINRFYNLTCELCNTVEGDVSSPLRFSHLNDLLAHYQEAHAQRGHVRCCDTTLSRYPAIIMHMARHLQPYAFRCETCGYVVTRPRFLDAHRQTHLPDEQKKFGCAYCERRFCWKRAVVLHERTHTETAAERRRFVCQDCGKIFESAGGLGSHRKVAHTGLRQETGVCHICAKSFATRAGLNEHMELHRPREHTQVQCTVCEKWLMNQRCLKTHMILHTDVLLQCDECPYTTKKPVLMRRHRVNRHTDDKPFACTLCDKTFKLKRPLTVHMAEAHTKEKRKFECPFCDRQFNSSTNFYTHRKNRHPKELAALRAEEAEERRQRRIEAGVEAAEGDETVLEYVMVHEDEDERMDDEENGKEVDEEDEFDGESDERNEEGMVEMIEMDDVDVS